MGTIVSLCSSEKIKEIFLELGKISGYRTMFASPFCRKKIEIIHKGEDCEALLSNSIEWLSNWLKNDRVILYNPYKSPLNKGFNIEKEIREECNSLEELLIKIEGKKRKKLPIKIRNNEQKKIKGIEEASVIVLNKNRVELLKKCLESIEENTKDVGYLLYIIDAGSTDGSREYLLKEWSEKATLIFEGWKTTYGESNNNILRQLRTPYAYLLNNDCEVLPGWLRNAIDFAEENKEVGHVASLVLNQNGTVQSHGANLTKDEITLVPYANKPLSLPELNTPSNWAYAGLGLYRKDVLEKINYLPEYRNRIYWFDVGHSLRTWEAGYTVTFCPTSKVIHKLSPGERIGHFDSEPIGRMDFLGEWGEFLKENDGFKPDYPFTQKRPYRNKRKRVAILVRAIFFFDGSACVYGGVERYTIDLCKLLRELGYEVEIFQSSDKEWQREIEGFIVWGIGENTQEFDTCPNLNIKFHSLVKNFDFVIYNGFNLCYPLTVTNSISIHHGIWWDSILYKTPKEFYRRKKKCIQGVEKVVAVDTNGINWTRARWPEIKNKFEYIPNYVDLKKFKPIEKQSKTFNILFPRRLEKARGWDITLDITEELTSEYSDIYFNFVGRGGVTQEKKMKKISQNNKQINWNWLPAEQMSMAYYDIDLCLIPTIWSEGTSLSCLEAMACGLPIIAGRVGGITDLIINDFNGVLIQVTKESLKREILKLYKDKKKRIELGKNARETALEFSKEKWEGSWRKVIKEVFIK